MSPNKFTLCRLMPADWNYRVYTETDFYNLCTGASVEVIDGEQPWDGCYFVYEEIHFIFVSSRLSGPRWLHVAMHEWAHFRLHVGCEHHLHDGNRRAQLEANIVAACALIPLPLLYRVPPWELVNDFGYWPELVTFREEVFRLWQL